MSEQHGGGEQPGAWEAWTAPAGQPGQADPRQAREPADGQPDDLGNAESSGQAAPAQPPPPATPESASRPAALTQPIGYPQADYPRVILARRPAPTCTATRCPRGR